MNERIKFINYPIYKYTRKGDNVIYEKREIILNLELKQRAHETEFSLATRH